MNTLRGFSRGGMAVHRTVPFDSRPIENAFLPKNAVILMRDSPWVPDARLAVGEGQEVREGQLLGRALSPGSSNVFSPIPGIVTRVSRIRVPGGYESDAVSISLQGAFSILGKKPERYLWKSLSKSDITHIMRRRASSAYRTASPCTRPRASSRTRKPGPSSSARWRRIRTAVPRANSWPIAWTRSSTAAPCWPGYSSRGT